MPRALYSQPADVFGGWFLGNPGMNFFQASVQSSASGLEIASPLFANPVAVTGPGIAGSSVTVGIRPERVSVSASPAERGVEAGVRRKSITIGQQYLLTLERGGQVLKAKVPAATGRNVGEIAWIELPPREIVLFDENGQRAALEPVASDAIPSRI
jgi:ABC-type sugar transport system ATPase subunit